MSAASSALGDTGPDDTAPDEIALGDAGPDVSGSPSGWPVIAAWHR
jgi:hypothetical protein